MLSYILPFLKSKLAAFGAVIVIVLVLVIGGPMIFGHRWRNWFYLAAALIVIVFLIYLAVKAWRAKRKARLLEGFLKKQAEDQVISSRADVKDELGAIKNKLDKAIAILKRSRLAKARGGAEALYVLPWYMIIGPSAAGKSTALRNSGLNFPPIDTDSADPGRVKGLGGTRNCDWWFTNEGIILDTAGRYTISSQGAEDREEWTKFLLMLKKARARAPINGLLLAISMEDILKKSEDERVEMAKALRARIDELIVKLEILFPIYVIFTKCDLIAGFSEFFGDYNRDWRDQVWGYTRKHEPSKTPLHQEFAAECARLTAVLDQRRLRQLATEVRPINKRATYLFPLEFEAATQRLAPFIETLFAPNPYQQNPMVRGFYFTSGTQEGAPIAQVMAAMRRDYGLSSAPATPPAPAEPKAYFIRDVFQEIILPDESVVLPTTAAEKRRRVGRFAFFGAAAALIILGFSVFLSTYLRNRSTAEYLAAIAGHAMAVTSASSGYSVDALDSLEVLRATLERMEQGPGFFRRWGLYFGDIPIDAARQAYFKRYHDLFLVPSSKKLENRLRESRNFVTEEESDRYFQSASSYLMMTAHKDSVRLDIGSLLRECDTLWRSTVPVEDQGRFEHLLDVQTRYYRTHRTNADLRWMRAQADGATLADIKQAMANYWTVGRLYRIVVDDASAALGNPYTMLDAAPGSVRVQGGEVARAFTVDGWEKHVEQRIEKMPDEIAADPELTRVFGRMDGSKLKEELTSRYAAEYRNVWRVFIETARLVPISDLTEATTAIDELAQPTSPMLGVLKAAYANSKIDIGGRHENELRAEFEPLGKFLGEIETDGAGETGAASYLKLMSEVPKLTGKAAEVLQSDARCAIQVKQLNTAIDERRRAIGRLIAGSNLARACASWLSRPLDAARSAAGGEACACLNRLWEPYYKKFQTTFEHAYPFNRSAENEAPRSEVAGFFGSTGGIFAFDESEGAPARAEGIGMSGDYMAALSVAEQLRAAIPGGQLSVAFTVTASSRNLTGLRMVRFEYGSSRFDYAMGQDESRNFKWPSPGTDLQASLSIEPINQGLYASPKRYVGDWALMRLFDEATPSGSTMNWSFPASGQTLTVRFDLSGSGAEFIRSGHFSRFRCPVRACP